MSGFREHRFIRWDRRTALKGAGFLGIGLVLRGAAFPMARAAVGNLTGVKGGDATPSLFVSIHPNGTIEVTCHRSEMGQQTWTAMAQIIADELEADWDRVEIVQAIGHPKYGDQNTDGSRSVRRNFYRLRITGAALRHQLEHAAAAHWKVPVGEVQANNGFVMHMGSGRRIGFGSLSRTAGEQPLPSEQQVKLKKRSEWRYIGKPIPSLIAPKVVRGEGTYGIDVQLPEMVHAVILRPPQVMGSVKTVDDTETRKVPGVLTTWTVPSVTAAPVGFKALGGVAVVAKNTWAAIKGRRALKVAFNDGPGAEFASIPFEKSLADTALQKGEMRRNRGDVYPALEASPKRISADYYVPFLAHATMEPPSATARWGDDETVECWGAFQNPQAARTEIANACGLKPESVTVYTTWLGGGFGRKSKPDFGVEAALIAREVKKPVKVTWTREDDLQHGYYHTVSAQHMEAGMQDSGTVDAWLHRTVFPTITSTFSAGADRPSPLELGLGASDTPVDVPNLRLETGNAPSHLRMGWLRSVSNIYHAFAVQSFISELAHHAGKDPKDMLLALLGKPRSVNPNTEGAEYGNYGDPLEEYPIDVGRLIAVTQKAAEMAGWGRKMKAGQGLGIACHRSFLSYVATVVEVEVGSKGELMIPKVWSVIDAGTVVNTNHTAAQLEGGTLFGLSNALYGEITAERGAVVQANYPDWRIMRMKEAPKAFAVHIMPSDAPPGGVGEPGTPPAAPALANAIFAATGHRYRRLPILGASGQHLRMG